MGTSKSVRLSLGSIVAHVLVAVVGPFCVSNYYLAGTTGSVETKESSSVRETALKVSKRPNWNLPLPVLHHSKKAPDYTYTGQCVDDPYSESADGKSTWSQHHVDVHMHINEDHEENLLKASLNQTSVTHEEEEEPVAEGFDGYQPAGQHLLMDIQNVDSSFLLDTEKLAHAMVQITKLSSLTLLSYHCHDLQAPMGVSCAGVLLESHVSFHTWPQAGIITLDLFTCGPASLLPLVPVLEDLFAIKSSQDEDPEPAMRWLYKKRGYRDYHEIVQQNLAKYADPEEIPAKEEEEEKLPAITATGTSIHKPEGVDLERYFLGWKGYHHKGIVVNEETKFQEVAVFEMAQSKIPLSRVHDDGVHVLQSNKKLFLDNHAQSSLLGMEAYHEALVHPALLAHPSPKRVAIIGSGEGAALRECLKHETVDTCTLLEIDADFVRLAQEQMQEWNDCSDFAYNKGTSGYVSCFNDTRTDFQATDALVWFKKNFGPDAKIDEEDKYDVVIMDAFDPSSPTSLSKDIYGSEEFVAALANSLTEEGILISQLSLSHGIDHVDLDPVFKMLQEFVQNLRSHGALSMKSYGEAHGELMTPWDFQAFFMGDEARANWLDDPAEIDFKLSQRAVETKSGNSPFKYIDGATMTSWQYPSQAQEDISCDSKPELALCDRGHTLDAEVAALQEAMVRFEKLWNRREVAAASVASSTETNETMGEETASTADAAACSDCELS
eukprot:CAMPEP_0172443210 /NCGR_PEP_ID=MMETSP1065-20121228/3509_1 /TAXON_ID=265537 /ORGANISM="Amphiprora paludosa, Strain CCMP125" /LENGTH=722 /DNA_ID=CAMNT_0013193367 /DNA_START=61 /DNA_END=2229 /DNA_ORIENTATION=+